MQDLSTHWKSRKNNLSFAVTNKIGQLALSVSFVTYLAALEPQSVVEIIRGLLKPCIEEKGLPFDSETILHGLLGGLYIKSSNETVKDEPAECEPLDKDSSSKTSEEPHSSDDSPPNQSTTDLQTPPTEAEPQMEPVSNNNQSNAIVDQYRMLIVNILHALDQTQSLKTLTLSKDTIMHRLLSELLNHSWNKWPLVYDPHNIIMSILDDKWRLLDAQDM